ncbi:MAG: DUF979 domain-containing protein [Alphaproteobacteria bacterium]|nr:DUF979 domain-containing protein [Alphaproteobacteria bacterium]
MIGIGPVYVLAGLMFGAMALMSARDRSNPRRWRNAGFWGLYAVSFLFGDFLGDLGNGILVLVMVAVAAAGLGIGRPQTTTPDERRLSARKFGNAIFAPALAIPLVTIFAALVLRQIFIAGRPLIDPAQTTLIGLGLACVTALVMGRVLLKQRIIAAVDEGRRLMDLLGWAAVLPQMLSALGAVFTIAGVGTAIGQVASQAIPGGSRAAAVIAYALGMALFTAVMGNAFAAFPVLTIGIGLPLIVMKFHGDPVAMSAIGMLSGFCGTLTTPMAANFNLVPAALLGLKNRYGVIAVQIPTAILLLMVNMVLMYAVVFR